MEDNYNIMKIKIVEVKYHNFYNRTANPLLLVVLKINEKFFIHCSL